MSINKQENNTVVISAEVDKADVLSKKFMSISAYSVLENIPEILSEWWAHSGKDMRTFLEDEGLINITNEHTFTDMLLGKYYFSEIFLVLIKEKLPYNISLGKLYLLNRDFHRKHLGVTKLQTDNDLILSVLKNIYVNKKEKRLKSIIEWHNKHKEAGKKASAKYRRLHPAEIKASRKKYREAHKEEIKAYKANRRSIENAQQRERYRKDIEQSRELKRAYYKKYKEKHKEQILESQAKYRQEHREEIRARAKIRMEDETYQLKVKESRKSSYKRHSAEIQARKKQRRLQNIEEAKLKERVYGKTYRESHREEIKIRDREKYHQNLLENRAKSAERQRKCRNKKRFKKVTGPMIMPLLSAILAAKRQ